MTPMTMTIQAQVQSRLEQMVEQGKARAMRGLEALHREYQIRRDMMVKPQAIDVEFTRVDLAEEAARRGQAVAEVRPSYREMYLKIDGGGHDGGSFALTPHARGQLLSAADVPTRFADTLVDHGLADLLRENVRRLLAKTTPDGLLIREVGGTVKGVLSPAYRRMDLSPLFEAFIAESLRTGLVPHSGEVTDTRAFATFMRPEVIELLPQEYVVAAVELRGSDYGNGAVDLALSLWRLLCSNGAIGASMFRKVHLGRRFDGFGDENVVRLSQQTIELDTRTIQSALRDSMKALPAHVDATLSVLRLHAGRDVDLTTALARLTKSGLRKETAEKVKLLYTTEQPVEALPPQPGAWRLSNALSLLANSAQGDEAHDLREMAFDVIAPRAA